jgi:hypothetical protein
VFFGPLFKLAWQQFQLLQQQQQQLQHFRQQQQQQQQQVCYRVRRDHENTHNTAQHNTVSFNSLFAHTRLLQMHMAEDALQLQGGATSAMQQASADKVSHGLLFSSS